MSPLVLALVVLQSAVYSWTDKSGVEHFTDDLSSIPQGVKVRTTEGAEISRIESEAPKRPATVAAAPSEPAIPSRSEQVWRQLFKDARNKVTDLEAEIESDRTKVEEVNGLPVMASHCSPYYAQPIVSTGTVVIVLGQPFPTLGVSGTVVGPVAPHYASPCFYGLNPEFERLRERLAKNRREVVRARDDLADLERRASFEAVPLQWRR